MTADVLATAAAAALTVSDPGAIAPGRLVNGTHALTQPLLATGSALPATVKAWATPVSHQPVTIEFSQSIDANEPLRTGNYTKTLTFTLATQP